MVDLGVVIVTHNSREFLENCLASLNAGGISTDVVVVDNSSTDGSVELIRERFPGIRIIANASNRGFAAANNEGFRYVQSRYILLLNPDTVVHGRALESLVSFMAEHPTASAAGPAIRNRDGSPQRTGVRFPSNWNIFVEALFLDRLFSNSRLFGAHKELYEDPAKARQVDYVQGSCLVVRNSVINNTGLLDERFFMYFEETDWCYRMKQAGGEIWYSPVASITHFGGDEFAHYDEQRLVAFHQSLMYFYQKHHSKQSRVLLRMILVLRSLIRLAVWTPFLLFGEATSARALSTLRGYLRVIPLVLSGRLS